MALLASPAVRASMANVTVHLCLSDSHCISSIFWQTCLWHWFCFINSPHCLAPLGLSHILSSGTNKFSSPWPARQLFQTCVKCVLIKSSQKFTSCYLISSILPWGFIKFMVDCVFKTQVKWCRWYLSYILSSLFIVHYSEEHMQWATHNDVAVMPNWHLNR